MFLLEWEYFYRKRADFFHIHDFKEFLRKIYFLNLSCSSCSKMFLSVHVYMQCILFWLTQTSYTRKMILKKVWKCSFKTKKKKFFLSSYPRIKPNDENFFFTVHKTGKKSPSHNFYFPDFFLIGEFKYLQYFWHCL